MIIKIILAIFALLPKDLRKAAANAFQITSRIKRLIEENQDLLEWTDWDEKIIAFLSKIEGLFGREDESLQQYLLSLKPEALNAILAQIAMHYIKEETDGKFRNSVCKLALEANIAKDKHE